MYYLLQDCMPIDRRAHARRILDPNTVADPVSGARDHLLYRRSTRVAVVVRILFLVFSTYVVYYRHIVNRQDAARRRSRAIPVNLDRDL